MLHILALIAMFGIIIYLHIDNLKFFKKLDRIHKLSKNGGSFKEINKITNSL